MEKIAAILVILVALGLIGLSIFGPKNFGSGVTFDKEATITLLPDKKLDPDRVTMSGGRVKITIVNSSPILGQFEIYDPVESRVIATWDSVKSNGGSEMQWVDLVKGRRYEMYDPIYKNKGMKGVLIAQ